MKWIIAVAALTLLAASTRADESEFGEDTDANEARLGYITVDNSGTTSITFNATSIQNAVILGLFILVLGALLLPLFGLFGEEESSGYEQTGYQSSGYEQASSGYNTYSKRSASMMSPIVQLLSDAFTKYDDEEEH